MSIRLFLEGILIGFSIAAPVGPIGVLCIRRTLSCGRLSGLISGLGAATADALYGSIAVLGLTFISGFLVGQQIWLGVIGGLFLCYLGIKSFRESPQLGLEIELESSNPKLLTQCEAGTKNLLMDYGSTFFLTLTNPITILSFTAIYAGLGIGVSGNTRIAGLWLVAGVFWGSAIWWLALSTLSNILREKFMTARGLMWINKISGIVLIIFGLAALVVVFRMV